LALRRPRRIFRGSAHAHAGAAAGLAVRATMVIGLAGMLISGGLVLRSHRTSVSNRPPALSGTLHAEASSVAVVDGGTLRLRDTVVRLAGVAAPVRGQRCEDGLGGSYDCGAPATAALAGLVRGRGVSCRFGARDGIGLTQAVCEAGGTDLGQALIAAGWARARPDGAGPDAVAGGAAPGREAPRGEAIDARPPDRLPLDNAEADARSARRGMWRNGAQPDF
jgi:endonuclease YncB( thermonuclease family)